jgi:hypothetical protein
MVPEGIENGSKANTLIEMAKPIRITPPMIVATNNSPKERKYFRFSDR